MLNQEHKKSGRHGQSHCGHRHHGHMGRKGRLHMRMVLEAGDRERRFSGGRFDGFGDLGDGSGRGRGGRGFDRDGRGAGGMRGDGGARGGGRRRQFDNEGLRLLLLHLTSQEPRHGYEMIRAIEELSGGLYVPSPGMVYPALSLLAEMEQIEQQPGEGARKRFAITPAGDSFLAEHAQERDAVLARLQHLSQRATPSADHAPIFRAMDNLKAALRIRLEREGADADTILDVAALIDEAAAKIERLK
ncbi:MAG: PadR family transcriptional regulator [Sphingobium sp.]|nr:PadR family transcriptional regulator [Sphingobium sp.]